MKLKFMRASMPATIEIRKNLKTVNAQILGDPTILHQVLMNLFTNAAHAMRGKGGVLEVSLDTTDITRDESAQFKDIKTGSYLELIVNEMTEPISRRDAPSLVTKTVMPLTAAGTPIIILSIVFMRTFLFGKSISRSALGTLRKRVMMVDPGFCGIHNEIVYLRFYRNP